MESIEWHKDCLKNQKRNLENEIKILHGLQIARNLQQEGMEHYELQINTAKNKGKSSFDRDRFMKKK